jgi:hypothetical protein
VELIECKLIDPDQLYSERSILRSENLAFHGVHVDMFEVRCQSTPRVKSDIYTHLEASIAIFQYIYIISNASHLGGKVY